MISATPGLLNAVLVSPVSILGLLAAAAARRAFACQAREAFLAGQLHAFDRWAAPPQQLSGGIIMSNGVSLGTLVWLIIGLVVALSHGYPIADLSSLVSFMLAIFLWPLVLFGVDLHINFGA